MNQYQAYPFALNEAETHYKFQSIGKKGIVEKAISFSPIAPQIYNLALLDYCPVRRDYVDDTVTDNGDVPEIMATVMAVVLKFLEDHPDNLVALSGNSKARTRLYQISIGKVFVDVQDFLVILGYRNQQWFFFEPNGSFESFLIGKKSLDS